jgi:hypothetical protein
VSGWLQKILNRSERTRAVAAGLFQPRFGAKPALFDPMAGVFIKFGTVNQPQITELAVGPDLVRVGDEIVTVFAMREMPDWTVREFCRVPIHFRGYKFFPKRKLPDPSPYAFRYELRLPRMALQPLEIRQPTTIMKPLNEEYGFATYTVYSILCFLIPLPLFWASYLCITGAEYWPLILFGGMTACLWFSAFGLFRQAQRKWREKHD